MTNKTGTALAPMKALRELMGFDPFRRFPERFFEGFDPFMTFGGENWPLATWALICDIYENNNFVGARGVGRVERLLTGSVSSAVAARAHCSVEVVRGA